MFQSKFKKIDAKKIEYEEVPQKYRKHLPKLDKIYFEADVIETNRPFFTYYRQNLMQQPIKYLELDSFLTDDKQLLQHAFNKQLSNIPINQDIPIGTIFNLNRENKGNKFERIYTSHIILNTDKSKGGDVPDSCLFNNAVICYINAGHFLKTTISVREKPRAEGVRIAFKVVFDQILGDDAANSHTSEPQEYKMTGFVRGIDLKRALTVPLNIIKQEARIFFDDDNLVINTEEERDKGMKIYNIKCEKINPNFLFYLSETLNIIEKNQTSYVRKEEPDILTIVTNLNLNELLEFTKKKIFGDMEAFGKSINEVLK